MCSTPASVATALVAARIWSGTGEVNTSPGQAASSMPYPTKPPCRGSCPDPPPDTRLTLPGVGPPARVTYRSAWFTDRDGWAAATPARASARTSSGALISFFTAVAPSSRVRRHHGFDGLVRFPDRPGVRLRRPAGEAFLYRLGRSWSGRHADALGTGVLGRRHRLDRAEVGVHGRGQQTGGDGGDEVG